jgi:translation initiation factor 3 subunit A
LQKLDNIDTDGLLTMQVAQFEKEKKEMNERLRITAKRIDHVERAYRKEERPLLDQDYEQQQKHDRETFLNVQKAHREAARRAHEEKVAAKHRLTRILSDYQERKAVILERKGADYKKKIDLAQKKLEEEKEKRRKAVFKAREEERLRIEKEEAEARAQEEEERRREEGKAYFVLKFCVSAYQAFNLQSVAPRRNALLQRRRRRSVKKRRSVPRPRKQPLLPANNANRSDKKQQKRRASSCSERKRPKPDAFNAAPKRRRRRRQAVWAHADH